MPRALWSGSLSFGLVNVPVQLVSGVRDRDLHFRQLHDRDHTPVETRRVCSEEGREVAYEEIAHGYEREDGSLVVLTDEELAAAAPRKTRTIDIEAFVDLADVDPIHFDHPYFLVPAGGSEGTLRAYTLLLAVMARTDRAALGRFVLRRKEHLVALRMRDERLALSTLLFRDEVRPAADVPTGGREDDPSERQVEQAVRLIEALSRPWEPGRYEDRYEQRLRRVIERKRKGETVRAPKREAEPSPVPDLMAALEESLRAATGRRQAPAEPQGGDALDELSRDELYRRARDAGVAGRSSMSKDELIDALR